MGPAALSSIPVAGWFSRTLLAVSLAAALAVDRLMPTARQRARNRGSVLVVALATYLTSAAFVLQRLLHQWRMPPESVASVGLAARCAVPACRSLLPLRLKNDQEKKSEATLFDYSLFIVASLNVICHVASSVSRQLFDGPFSWRS